MIRSKGGRAALNLGLLSAVAILLGACGSIGSIGLNNNPPPAPEPAVAPEVPATIRSDELVGRWGLASYQNPADQARTEAAAKAQCRNPYVIGAGAHGGVVMHLADEATPQELKLKGSQSGKNYIGPEGPPGGPQDREIISFNGQVMVTRFIDPDAATRYGNMVYVRCAAGAAPPPRHAATRSRPK
ncbi:MAG TPA: hypothetical protein VHC94_14535 [Nitrobacter sp.]|jgi:hypothetical protein|nr:hypothetical protein [Nitrobacter sp.]